METGQLTVFTLGQSTVVTLPKKWGLKSGSKIPYKKTTRKVNLEISDNQITQALDYVKKHAGSIKINSPLTLEQMSDEYEKDTYGDVFPRF
jgi:hypothetical protein